jgi:hypothetical protein
VTKILGFTYKPKILAVLDGRCTQTIRYGRRIAPLEPLLLHGWTGRPYYDPWSWRKRVVCIEATPIKVYPNGISYSEYHIVAVDINMIALEDSKPEGLIGWDTARMDRLAQLDFISPPTGVELGNALLHMHKIGEAGEPFQIVRWKP